MMSLQVFVSELRSECCVSIEAMDDALCASVRITAGSLCLADWPRTMRHDDTAQEMNIRYRQ